MIILLIAGLCLGVVSALLWAGGIFRGSGAQSGRSAPLPRISVIIAARNEESYLPHCLRSLLALDYPADRIEILVVDDHSTDRTAEIAREIGSTSGIPFRVLESPDLPAAMGPKKRALDFAIRQASGELLLFTDADCSVARGWARALVQEYASNVGAVASVVMPKRGVSPDERLYYLDRLLVNYTAASALGWGFPSSVNGGSFSYRRDVFQQLGGFAFPETASGDDDLMAQAIARAGWTVRFAQGAAAVVNDLREPMMRRQFQAAIRHQSTIGYYPKRWRLLYILSIAGGAAFLISLPLSYWFTALRSWLAITLIARMIADGVAYKKFCLRNALTWGVVDFLAAELILPIYLLIRPLLSFRKAFEWQARAHRKSTPTATV